MTTEIEQTLARELHEVADGVRVPPMPPLVPADEPRSGAGRHWQPLLVAAAVALIAGVVALVIGLQGDGSPQPAPPAPPSPAPTLSTGAPTVPYVLDQRLYVDGRQVPGDWWFVESRHGVWVAQRTDGAWWWGGPGVEAGLIDATIEQAPVISPNGRYIAYVVVIDGRALVNGFTTGPSGEGFGPPPADAPSTEDGVAVTVRAVTDDGEVILQGTRTSLMWPTVYDGEQAVVDLSETAPDQVVLQATPAGLVVVDGANGAVDATSTAPYLATVSPDGRLTRAATLPTYDALDVSPSGAWLVRSPAGTLGGEVTSVATLWAQRVGSGDDEVVLEAPAGWGFANNVWAWEDDETLVSVLLPADGDESRRARPVRCSVALGECRALAAPSDGADPTESYSAKETLAAVVGAVVADDRAGLVDQTVVDDGEWGQLLGYAARGDGSVSGCRDNGGGTWDCGIVFKADRNADYYAIVEPATNDYGWRVSYVGIGGA